MKQNKKFDEEDHATVPDFEISSVDILLKARMLLISTLSGEVFMLSDKFNLDSIKYDPPNGDDTITISESLIFEHKQALYLCLGFSSG